MGTPAGPDLRFVLLKHVSAPGERQAVHLTVERRLRSQSMENAHRRQLQGGPHKFRLWRRATDLTNIAADEVTGDQLAD